MCAGLAVLLTEVINKMGMVSTKTEFAKGAFCHLWLTTYVMGAFIIASAYNLVFITMERYFAITNPMKYDRRKVMKRLPFVMMASWVLGKIIF